MNTNSLTVVQNFLTHIFSGQMQEALTLVSPKAIFIAARPNTSQSGDTFHGTFIGPEGAATLFASFGAVIEPGEFNTTASFSEDEHVAMYGNLRHKSRATGRDFSSDWALICQVRDGQIIFYHFYEDTALIEAAMKP